MGDLIHVSFSREPEAVLKKAELAHRLGYTVRHIEKLTALGMPSKIVGRCRVYRETECRNWLSQRDRKGVEAYAR